MNTTGYGGSETLNSLPSATLGEEKRKFSKKFSKANFNLNKISKKKIVSRNVRKSDKSGKSSKDYLDEEEDMNFLKSIQDELPQIEFRCVQI